jgi:O-antigen ligase
MALKKGKYYFSQSKNWVPGIFIAFNLSLIVFSVDFMKSAVRISAWLPFLLYINFFLIYLFRNYESQTVRLKLVYLFCLVYLFPLGIMFIYGNPLLMGNIYGGVIGGFKTNTLGWASIAFFVTAVDLLLNARPGLWSRRFLIGALFFAVLVLSSTGSRSSYLCLALSLVILVVNSRKMSLIAKVVTAILITAATSYQLGDPASALNKRIEKSENQLEKGEYRFQMADVAMDTMFENPELLLTGFGFDNSREGIAQYTGITFALPTHNSYLELFITTGLFSFAFFLIFLVLNAIIKYILYDIRRYIFLPTFMIIPFFESNLNAGQFLFFPWMTFMFYYVHSGSRQIPIPRNPEMDNRSVPHSGPALPMPVWPQSLPAK